MTNKVLGEPQYRFNHSTKRVAAKRRGVTTGPRILPRPHHGPNTGLTTLELLITLVLVSVLLAAGIPSFNNAIASNRITATQQSLVDAITLARSEAIKRGQPIMVCASLDNQTCSTDPLNWNTGWLVASSLDADGETLTPGSPEAVLLALTSEHQIRLITTSPQVTFRADGSVQQAFFMQICDESALTSPQSARNLEINFAGRLLQDTRQSTTLCSE